MSENNDAPPLTIDITVFDNAFIYQTNHVSVNYTFAPGRIWTRHGKYFEFIRDDEVLFPYIHEGAAIFEGSFDDTEVVEVRVHEVIEGYTSDEEGFKDIDKETYDKLTPNFQEKYHEVKTGEVYETRHDVNTEVNEEHENIVFDRDTYLGHKVSELRKILDGEDYLPRMSVKNLLPRNVEGLQVLRVLEHLYRQEKSELKQLKAHFRIVFKTYGRRDHDDYISVEYFVTPYNGEKRKVYGRKANGRRYADGRHTFVDNFPKVASKVTVHEEDLDAMPFDGDDTENMSAIRSLYHAVFHPPGTITA